MSRKRSNAFSEFVTGLFMLVVLALLAYFTIIISGVDLIRGRERIQVSIMFDGVGGLKDHDNVMYRGTKVGTVEDVILTETNLVAVVEIDKCGRQLGVVKIQLRLQPAAYVAAAHKRGKHLVG